MPEATRLARGHFAQFQGDTEVFRRSLTERAGATTYFRVRLTPTGLDLPAVVTTENGSEGERRNLGRLPRLVPQDARTRNVYLALDVPDGTGEQVRVLRDGFGMFEESVADVQLLLQGELARLQELALFAGPTALAAEAARVRERVEQERAVLDEELVGKLYSVEYLRSVTRA